MYRYKNLYLYRSMHQCNLSRSPYATVCIDFALNFEM